MGTRKKKRHKKPKEKILQEQCEVWPGGEQQKKKKNFSKKKCIKGKIPKQKGGERGGNPSRQEKEGGFLEAGEETKYFPKESRFSDARG